MQISPDLLEKMKNNQTSPPHDPDDVTYLVINPKEGETPKESYEGTEPELNIDKSWNILHWLLSGRSDVAYREGTKYFVSPEEQAINKTIMGGTEIGKDVGYGPARYLDPNEVKQVSEALEHVSREDLQKKWDPEALANLSEELYPSLTPDAWRNPAEAEYYLQSFDKVKGYYQSAASKGNALLLWTD